jgi:hypothetical protein
VLVNCNFGNEGLTAWKIDGKLPEKYPFTGVLTDAMILKYQFFDHFTHERVEFLLEA